MINESVVFSVVESVADAVREEWMTAEDAFSELADEIELTQDDYLAAYKMLIDQGFEIDL